MQKLKDKIDPKDGDPGLFAEEGENGEEVAGTGLRTSPPTPLFWSAVLLSTRRHIEGRQHKQTGQQIGPADNPRDGLRVDGMQGEEKRSDACRTSLQRQPADADDIKDGADDSMQEDVHRVIGERTETGDGGRQAKGGRRQRPVGLVRPAARQLVAPEVCIEEAGEAGVATDVGIADNGGYVVVDKVPGEAVEVGEDGGEDRQGEVADEQRLTSSLLFVLHG